MTETKSTSSMPVPSQIQDEIYDPSGRYQKSNTHIEQSLGVRHVFKAFDTETAVEVAWQEYWGVSAATMNAIEKRIATLKSLEHQHIIKYHEAWVDRKQKKVIFITEAMPTGRGSITNVKRFLTRNVKMKSSVLKNWLDQILQGLQFLHSQDPPWIHRDLRCVNIYIRSNIGLLKIGGLELGIFMQTSHPAEFDGTPGYMPPELANDKVDCKTDVYAFGMCALEMFTFKYPFGECSSSYQIFAKQLRNELPEALADVPDSSASELITKCLLPGAQRPTLEEIKKCSFFTGQNLDSEEPVVSLDASVKLRESTNSDQKRSASSGAIYHLGNGSSVNQLNVSSKRISNVPAISVPPLTDVSQIVHPPLDESFQGASSSIKCYSGDGTCIRIYFRDIPSVRALKEIIATDLGLEESKTKLVYIDTDEDKVLFTQRTTIQELQEFAKSIQILS